MKNIYLFFSLVCLSLNLLASDFAILNSQGKLIHYNFTSGSSVGVTNNPNNYSGSITIPSTVTYNNNVYSVSSIEDYAFQNCTNLSSITIPNSILNIGSYAFSNCSSLSSITLPNSLKHIDEYAFYFCTSLQSIVLPDSISQISSSCFYNTNISSINIPDNVKSIGNQAFGFCANLRKANLSNVINIDDYAFYYCTTIDSIIFPNTLKRIGYNAFHHCDSIKSVILPNSLTELAESSFSYCHSLEYLSLPSSLTKIKPNTFNYCNNIKYLNIPIGVTEIGENAFSNCFSLDSIFIPSTVQILGNSCFNNCGQLISLTNLALTPQTINSTTFTGVNPNAILKVPCGYDSIYQASPYWSSFTNIIDNQVVSKNINAIICNNQTYNLNGFNQNQSGIYSLNYTSQNSCDSVVNLFLNVKIPDTTIIEAKICYGYSFNDYGFNENSTGVYYNILQSSLGCDSVLQLNLEILMPDTLIINESVCPGYYFNGNGFYTSTPGTYVQNLFNSNGCDSIIILNLSNYSIDTTIINDFNCYGELYDKFGFNEYWTGTYIQHTTTSHGCDSVVILNLTTGDYQYQYYNESICQGQTFNQHGFNCDTTGVYRLELQSVNGCDSIIELNLTVNPYYKYEITDTVCQGYLIVGHATVDTSGIYIITQPNYYGCMDTTIYNLTVIETLDTNYIDINLCPGEYYTVNGLNYYPPGIYTINLQSVFGCDSIVVVNLIQNYNSNQYYNETICQGETFTQYGFNCDTSGVYTQELQTINGCDSIISLTLNVIPNNSTIIFDTICQGEDYFFYGINVSDSSGVYQYLAQTSNGCYDTMTLNLLVKENSFFNIDTISCSGIRINDIDYNSTGVYQQTLVNSIGCDSIININLTIPTVDTPEICMVTVNENNNNVIIWDKEEEVIEYQIYKEGTQLGQFEYITSIPYSEPSVWEDTSSNALTRSYRYKIAAKDTCEHNTEQSSSHKTLHLTINQGLNNTWNLIWTPYEGINYNTYNIYKGRVNHFDSLFLLTTIPSSSTSYTDFNTDSGDVYYQIEILIQNPCNITKSLNSIRSNIASNKLIGLEQIELSEEINLYPNPSNLKTTLDLGEGNIYGDIIIHNSIGMEVKRLKYNNKALEINIKDLEKGIYYINIRTKKLNITKKLIVI